MMPFESIMTLMSIAMNVIFVTILVGEWLKHQVQEETRKVLRSRVRTDAGIVERLRMDAQMEERVRQDVKIESEKERVGKVTKVKVATAKPEIFHFDEECQYYKAMSGLALSPCRRCIECMRKREGR